MRLLGISPTKPNECPSVSAILSSNEVYEIVLAVRPVYCVHTCEIIWFHVSLITSHRLSIINHCVWRVRMPAKAVIDLCAPCSALVLLHCCLAILISDWRHGHVSSAFVSIRQEIDKPEWIPSNFVGVFIQSDFLLFAADSTNADQRDDEIQLWHVDVSGSTSRCASIKLKTLNWYSIL